MKKLYLSLFCCILSWVCRPQNEALPPNAFEFLNNRIENVEKKRVNLGISLGFKSIRKQDLKYFTDEIISSIDSTLKLQRLDNGFIVLSTELLLNPFITHTPYYMRSISDAKKQESLSAWRFVRKMLEQLTLVASINLAEVNMAHAEFAFNKTIDGGLGFGFRLAENLWLAWTYEVTSHRRLRDYVRVYENQKVVIGGNTLTELDRNDNTLFYNKKLKANNFKFILKF